MIIYLSNSLYTEPLSDVTSEQPQKWTLQYFASRFMLLQNYGQVK
jgi:hypothetical protein